MIFLTKTNQAAVKYVTAFIDSNWREEGVNRYQNIGYSDIKNPVRTFRAFFIDEQDGKCCYCCRNIANDNTTELEHIIPRTKSEDQQFEAYYALSEVLRNNVVPQRVFTASTVRLHKPPFPHHIAYQNIVASCNGRTFEASDNFTCCNRVRQDDFIPPFNLIEGSVAYLADGTIVYMTDVRNREYFQTLNLNKDMLINIRRLWYLFSLSQLPLTDITDVDGNDSEILTQHLLVNAVIYSNIIEADFNLIELFTVESMWYSFKQFDFFLSYYRN